MIFIVYIKFAVIIASFQYALCMSIHLGYLASVIPNSGNCHPNPGPLFKVPFGECAKSRRSNQNTIACDSCDIWYNVYCMNMPLETYKGINSNVSWICTNCGLQYSFWASTSHSFSSISSSSSPQQSLLPIRSKAQQSQPQRSAFHTRIVNFLSIMAKHASFLLARQESATDIIIGCETWIRLGCNQFRQYRYINVLCNLLQYQFQF